MVECEWLYVVCVLLRCSIYFASAAVAVDSSHMTASSSASWSRFSPLSNFFQWARVDYVLHGLSLAIQIHSRGALAEQPATCGLVQCRDRKVIG